MSDQKGLGSKFLGLFVETDGSQPEQYADVESGDGKREKTAAELVAELAGQSAPGAKRPATPGKAPGKGPAAPPHEEPSTGPALKLDKVPPPVAGAPMDFDSIFKTAGMDAAELD